MPILRCPSCKELYADILEHIRKKHPSEAYTDLQLQPLGLTSCPICATACRGTHGVKTHSAKIHGTIGTSSISTLPRARLPTPSLFDITSPRTPRASLSRKRQARSPSPGLQRPQTRPRLVSSTRTFPRTRDLPRTIEPPSSLEASISQSPSRPRAISIASTTSTASITSFPSVSQLLEEVQREVLESLETPEAQILRETQRDTLETLESLEYPSNPRDLGLPFRNSREEISLEEKHNLATSPILARDSIQKLLAFSKIPIPEKKLHARQAALFIVAAQKAATSFLSKPSEKALLNFLILPRTLGLGLKEGGLGVILRDFPNNLPSIEGLEIPRDSQLALPIQSPSQKAKKLIERGFISRATRALVDPTPLAPDSLESRAILREKHPIGSKNPFQGKTRPRAGQPISSEAILEAIASIQKEKAPGLSGWTRPLLSLVTQADSSVIAFLRLLADMIRQGTAPGSYLLCASRLVGLEKGNLDIRPIAIGDLVYRVAVKAILVTSFKTEMLLPNQLGVSSPGGVEPAIFLLEEAIAGPNKAGYKKATSIDLANAFNSTNRSSIASSVAKFAPSLYKAAAWAYNNPSLLVTEEGAILASTEGVRQGDPLGPLLFSLAFRPTLELLIKKLPQATLIAYLDDLYILDKDQSTSALEVAREVFSLSPFSLNLSKSQERDIKDLRKEGLKALGSFIGPLEPRRDFLKGKLAILARTLEALQELPKQYSLLLLRTSIQLLLRHLQRQLNPEGLEDLWEKADSFIRDSIKLLLARGLEDLPKEINQDLISLPLREGGLGIPLHKELARGLFLAAKEASQATLDRILRNPLASPSPSPPSSPSTSLKTPKLSAQEVLKEATRAKLERTLGSLSASQKGARLENASYLGRKWLGVLPSQKQLSLADSEVTEALRSRLFLPVKPLGIPCSSCGAIASLGHEDTCKGASRRWISRHNIVARAFFKALSCLATIEAEEEPLVGSSSLRADFAITLGGSRYFYDIQIAAISKDSAKEDPFLTLREAAEEKRRKYSALGAFFQPLIFSAGGLMEQETAKAYKKLQDLIGPIGSSWLDSSIGLALTKTRAISAASIARETPLTAASSWKATREQFRKDKANPN
jgi:hypothetical protein